MSLLYWLPLRGDIESQGLMDAKATKNNIAILADGKIGKACGTGKSFIISGLTNASGTAITNASGTQLQAYTVSGASNSYIKLDNTSVQGTSDFSFALWLRIDSWNTAYETYVYGGVGSSPWNNYIFGLLRNNTANSIVFVISDGSSATNTNCVSPTLTAGRWYHVACTYAGGIMRMYIDGTLVKEYVTTIIPNFTKVAQFYVGALNSTGTYQTNSSYNDFRFYNHCLSQMEVKQLSQGLILHYPLDRNGWGQNNLLSAKYVQMSQWTDHGLSSATVTTDGYKNTYTLIKGISGWESFYSSAITLSAGTYTFSCQYKTHSDFTAYSGDFGLRLTTAVPTGNDTSTAIATLGFSTTANELNYISTTFTLSSETTVYVGINGGHITDGSENKIFNVNYIKLEEGTKVTPWCPNSSDELATLLDLDTTVEYDCSGFRNNGGKTGTLTYSSDTPKYHVSSVFSGSQYINVGTQLYDMRDEMTVSAWVHKDNWNTNKGTFFSSVEGGGFGWQVSNNQWVFYMGTGTTSNSYISVTVATTGLSSGWHMLSATYDGLRLRIYIDGELKTTTGSYTTKTPIYYNVKSGMFISGESAGSLTAPSGSLWNGKLSDVRIYATALSDTDMKSLYQNSAYIDSSGNVYGAIHNEV